MDHLIVNLFVSQLCKDRLVVGPFGLVTAMVEMELQDWWQRRNAAWLLMDLRRNRRK